MHEGALAMPRDARGFSPKRGEKGGRRDQGGAEPAGLPAGQSPPPSPLPRWTIPV